jgi:hypothetical protein
MSDAPQIAAANFADRIPILDPRPYLSGEPDALEAVSRELYRASTEVDFYYLKNHGVAPPLIDGVFEESRRFADFFDSIFEKPLVNIQMNFYPLKRERKHWASARWTERLCKH